MQCNVIVSSLALKRSFPYEHDLRLGHTASSGDVVLQLQELLQSNRPLLLVGVPQVSAPREHYVLCLRNL